MLENPLLAILPPDQANLVLIMLISIPLSYILSLIYNKFILGHDNVTYNRNSKHTLSRGSLVSLGATTNCVSFGSLLTSKICWSHRLSLKLYGSHVFASKTHVLKLRIKYVWYNRDFLHAALQLRRISL